MNSHLILICVKQSDSVQGNQRACHWLIGLVFGSHIGGFLGINCPSKVMHQHLIGIQLGTLLMPP